jgi:hypothetical protein
MGFQLVANTSPTVREISQKEFSQLIQNCITQLDLAAAGLLHPGQNGGDHHGVDVFSDFGSDEIEVDDVFSDPIQKFWPAEVEFEVAVNLGCHFCLHVIKVIIFRSIREALGNRGLSASEISNTAFAPDMPLRPWCCLSIRSDPPLLVVF